MAVVADCFTIGSKVACRTCYNQNIEGEVLAFDAHTKMLILKCPSSSGDARLNDVNIVNLALVSDVQILQEVSVMPDVPQTLDLHRLDTRVKKQIEDKRRLVCNFLVSIIIYVLRMILQFFCSLYRYRRCRVSIQKVSNYFWLSLRQSQTLPGLAKIFKFLITSPSLPHTK